MDLPAVSEAVEARLCVVVNHFEMRAGHARGNREAKDWYAENVSDHQVQGREAITYTNAVVDCGLKVFDAITCVRLAPGSDSG
jgi:hypothetical protein